MVKVVAGPCHYVAAGLDNSESQSEPRLQRIAVLTLASVSIGSAGVRISKNTARASGTDKRVKVTVSQITMLMSSTKFGLCILCVHEGL